MANQIVIHGRLTRDPELKSVAGKDGEITVCNISVAANRNFGNEADFFNCFQFGKRAEALEKFFSKGKEIVIFGEMQMNSYTDKNGSKHAGWKCKINNWEFCGGKSDGDNSSGSNSEATEGFSEIEGDIPF